MWKAAAVVTIALSILVAGSFGRYELVAGSYGLFRVDRLTGEVVRCGNGAEGSAVVVCANQ